MSNDEARALALSLEVLAWEERRDQADAHPTPERLAAYHSGELSAADDLEIQQHLVLCTDCPALLLDLEDLFDPRHRDLGLSDTGVTSAWRDLRSRLGGRRGGKGGGPPAAPARSWRSWLTAIPSPVYAAATGLLLVLTVGLAVRTFSLGDRTEQPEIASAPVSLDLPTRGEEEPPGRLKLGPEDSTGLLQIERGAIQHPPLWVSIFKDDDKMVWSSPKRRTIPDDAFLFVKVPRKALQPGLYKVILKGQDEARNEIEQEYRLEVTY